MAKNTAHGVPLKATAFQGDFKRLFSATPFRKQVDVRLEEAHSGALHHPPDSKEQKQKDSSREIKNAHGGAYLAVAAVTVRKYRKDPQNAAQ